MTRPDNVTPVRSNILSAIDNNVELQPLVDHNFNTSDLPAPEKEEIVILFDSKQDDQSLQMKQVVGEYLVNENNILELIESPEGAKPLFSEPQEDFADNFENESDSSFIPSANESDSDFDDINENQDIANSNVQKRWSKKLRTERKINRNRGKSYTTASGKVVKAREIKPLKNCRMKCSTKMTAEERKEIFEEYWNLGTYDKRVAFCASLINATPKAVERKRKLEGGVTKNRTMTYKYNLEINGSRINVCKSCFINTVGETEKFITCMVVNKKYTTGGSTYSDKRGKHAPAHKTSEEKLREVRNHIAMSPITLVVILTKSILPRI